jgi:hypothetical protein
VIVQTDPIPVDAESPTGRQVKVGSTITLSGSDFGDQSGLVGIAAGELMIPVQLVNWSDTSITITLPQVGLVNASAKAKVVVQRADGSVAKEMNVDMVAGE